MDIAGTHGPGVLGETLIPLCFGHSIFRMTLLRQEINSGEWGIVRDISLGQRVEAGRWLIPARPRSAGSPSSAAAPVRSADARRAGSRRWAAWTRTARR